MVQIFQWRLQHRYRYILLLLCKSLASRRLDGNMTTMDEDETAATSVAAKGFPDPQLGAPLLLAFSPPTSSAAVRKTVLVIGQQRLAAVRTFACLEAGLRVVLGVHNDARQLDAELQARLEARQVSSIEIPSNDYAWQDWLASIPPVIQNDISLVCVTDTLPSSIPASAQRSYDSAACIRHACFAARLPVNVADYPELSDFRFPATYRFPLLSDSATSATSGHSPYKASPLQIAITTNATSCRLASRLRREIVAKLPRGIGNAVEKIGRLREMAKEVDAASSTLSRERLDDGEREEGWSSTMLNKPVPQLSMPSRAKCTSPNRTKSIFHNVLPPSHIPPTPPATPPADSIGNKMEEMLSQSPSASDFKLSSRTRMRFIAQLCELAYIVYDHDPLLTNSFSRILAFGKTVKFVRGRGGSSDQCFCKISHEWPCRRRRAFYNGVCGCNAKFDCFTRQRGARSLHRIFAKCYCTFIIIEAFSGSKRN